MLDLITEITAITGRMKPLPQWTQVGAVAGLEGGTEVGDRESMIKFILLVFYWNMQMFPIIITDASSQWRQILHY